jgi:hypothetical protein
MAVLVLLLGLALSAAGWALVRWVARTPWRNAPLAPLDAIGPLAWWLILLAASARPIFSGVVCFATFGGLAFADYWKRATLREPVVFCDSVELIEVVRHPNLYLPFAGPGRVLAGAVVAAAAFCAAPALEPPVWAWSWTAPLWTALGCAGLLALLLWPLQSGVTRLLAWVEVTDDPATDGRRIGPLNTLLVYGVRARAERRARAEAAVAATVLPASPGPARGHVVLIQSESFVDPRHLFEIDAETPHLDAARRSGPLHGRLNTPAWGANTVRTEFQALTGVTDEALGFDRFNPYYAFVQGALPSLAWSLKARGYRTVCVHPFDGGFYGRRRVLPKLGFDAFYDIAAFSDAPRRHGFVTDAAVASFVETLLAQAEQPLFVFVVTMENHGPWVATAEEPGDEHSVYAQGVRNADALLGRMARATGADEGRGLVGFYGDHRPMLTTIDDDGRTDYVIWRAGAQPAVQDLPASALTEAILGALDARADQPPS